MDTLYVEGGGNAVEGTLRFTGNFKIAPEGQFGLEMRAKAQFEDITLEAGSRSKDFSIYQQVTLLQVSGSQSQGR